MRILLLLQDLANLLDYKNLGEGEKLLIYMHFKHEDRYYANGGKRKPVF
jgi:hypothetical protein